MPDEDYLTVCPNRRCRLVYRPDERVCPDSSRKCPKCGTDFAGEAERRAAEKERAQWRKDRT